MLATSGSCCRRSTTAPSTRPRCGSRSCMTRGGRACRRTTWWRWSRTSRRRSGGCAPPSRPTLADSSPITIRPAAGLRTRDGRILAMPSAGPTGPRPSDRSRSARCRGTPRVLRARRPTCWTRLAGTAPPSSGRGPTRWPSGSAPRSGSPTVRPGHATRRWRSTPRAAPSTAWRRTWDTCSARASSIPTRSGPSSTVSWTRRCSPGMASGPCRPRTATTGRCAITPARCGRTTPR